MSIESLKFAYRHLPIINRVGSGCYTYSFIVELDSTVHRFSIFADNIETAYSYTELIVGTPPVAYTYIAENTYELQFYGLVCNKYYLYLD